MANLNQDRIDESNRRTLAAAVKATTPNDAIDQPEVQAALKVLRESRYTPTQIRNAMKTMEIFALPEEERQFQLIGVARPLAEGENRITWYAAYDHVWLVKSSTQCEYCGPVSKWKIPVHARKACEPCRGTGRISDDSEVGRACTKCKGKAFT